MTTTCVDRSVVYYEVMDRKISASSNFGVLAESVFRWTRSYGYKVFRVLIKTSDKCWRITRKEYLDENECFSSEKEEVAFLHSGANNCNVGKKRSAAIKLA